MKTERHAKIIDLIGKHEVETQEELAATDLRDLLLCYAGTHSAPDQAVTA